MKSSLAYASLAVLLGVSALASVGCQNNTVDLHFESEGAANGDESGSSDTGGPVPTTSASGDAEADDGVVDTGPLPMPPIAGNWLLAISSPLDPSLPFQFLVLAEDIGGGLFNLTMTSLSLDVGSTTTPRQPVGEPKIFFGVPLSPDTGFEIFTGPLVIPAAANPISGSDVTVDILLSGLPTGQPYCGAVSGSVTAPAAVDLAGSTFGTEKVDDVATLPTTFAVACP